jgi:hypothetical protein
VIEISLPHISMSDVYLRDALSDAQSQRGLVDCALDSAYFALLSVLSSNERRGSEHPNAHLIEMASRRLGLDPSVGMTMMRSRYSPAQHPTLSEALEWAEGVRAKVRALTN